MDEILQGNNLRDGQLDKFRNDLAIEIQQRDKRGFRNEVHALVGTVEKQHDICHNENEVIFR